MVTIRLNYDGDSMCAVVIASDDCTDRQWASVCRLFEERCGSTAVEGRSLSCPWWEFVAFRRSFRYVLRTNSLDIEVSDQAKNLLRESIAREEEYRTAPRRVDVAITEDNLQLHLQDAGFARSLFPYQSRNVARLIRSSAGATYSVPGAGKTTEALAFFCLNRVTDEKLLVVAPNNAFVAWEDEIPACLPNGPGQLQRLTGGERRVAEMLSADPMLSIISYHQLPYVMGPLRAFLARNRVCMFVDESHRMKRGQDGVHGACILGLSYLAGRKLVLSGTPMPNSSGDLVSQFQFLYPDIRTTPDNVVDNIQPFFVRTTKEELGLPPVRRVQIDVPMSPLQTRLYSSLASDAARHLHGLSVFDRRGFRQVSKCVQYMLMAASNPGLLARSQIGQHQMLQEVMAEGIPPKLREASRLAREWAADGKKVLIWSSFVSTVEHLTGLLSDFGAEYIHGGVTTSEDEELLDSREAVIRRFNDPASDTRILVANPAACSEGISLHHVCHHAIYVDRNYNAAQYLQSEDRIHRIGVPDDVTTFIFTLATPDTIDVSVSRRLAVKVDRMAVALNDPCLNIVPISLDDVDRADADGIDPEDIADIKVLLGVAE